MSYWQKLYFSVLLLFLTVCNCCIFFVTKSMLDSGRKREEDFYMRETRRTEKSLTEDLAALSERVSLDRETLTSLLRGYVMEMEAENSWLQFSYDGENYGSNMPFAQANAALGGKNGKRCSWWCKQDGIWYFNVLGNPVEKAETFFLYRAETLGKRETRMIMTGAAFSASSAAALAVLLYFVTGLLNRPLARLSEAARYIAEGEYGRRIPVPRKKGGHTGKMDAPAKEEADEMIRLSCDFNAMADAVEEKIEALSEESRRRQEFIDNFAHEMRTPLTSIAGYGHMLKAAALDEEERFEAVERILTGALRLDLLREKLMTLCLAENAGTERKVLHTAKLLRQVREDQASYAKSCNVSVRIEGDNCPVRGDEVLLTSLFDNLLHNAVRAASGRDRLFAKDENILKNGREPEAGLVIIRSGMKDGCAQVSISDNGIGMSREQLERIGEPFYRVDKARSRHDGGAGLGVALCFKIAGVHGACLSYESNIGKGTTATVTFL